MSSATGPDHSKPTSKPTSIPPRHGASTTTVAAKILDGSGRAATAVAARLLERAGALAEADVSALLAELPLRVTGGGVEVGRIRPVF